MKLGIKRDDDGKINLAALLPDTVEERIMLAEILKQGNVAFSIPADPFSKELDWFSTFVKG